MCSIYFIAIFESVISAAVARALLDIIKNAKMYYTFSYNGILEKIQSLINDLDFNKVNSLLEQMGSVFEQENNDTMAMINELKDFKNIINK